MKKLDRARYFFEDNADKKHFSMIMAGQKVLLILDFDGTLVPIQREPAQCFLSEKMKRQLQLLAGLQCCYLMILSGRSLSDIRKRVGMRKIYYGGNHGLDISGRNLRYTHPKALLSKPVIDHVKRSLKKGIGNIDGAWLEDKKFTVSLHFRSVKKKNIPLVKKAFYSAANEFFENKSLGIIKGKKVLELVPDESWNKGSAVLLILQQLKDKCLPIYMGDDRTDEAAFKALKRRGITIRIGKSKQTAAKYYLKGYWEIPRLLREIQEYAEIFYETTVRSYA